MNANVYSNTLLIGHTHLQIDDKSMGCVYGEFIPTENYHKHVQRHVWAFWQDNRPDYQKWNSLKLNVQLENGWFLHPAGGYTIDDMNEQQSEHKRIDIAGISNNVIKDYFETITPRPFTEEPWAAISIEQKISFEDELRKEITPNNLLFQFAKGKHVLVGYDCSAVCNSYRADEVLFSVHAKNDSHNKYALVHLTYNKEIDPRWPATTFFKSFDEFKFRRMYPDKADLED